MEEKMIDYFVFAFKWGLFCLFIGYLCNDSEDRWIHHEMFTFMFVIGSILYWFLALCN